MEQKIEIINNWNLSKFFKELESGLIRIPRFQRGYIWEKSKITKLLNSIYAQYPIGSIFLWLAPKEYKNYIRDWKELGLPDDTNQNEYQFILDGQQRITSLYITLKGKLFEEQDYRTICFHLEKREFTVSKAKTMKHEIPAWKLLDPIAYGEILADYAIVDREKKTNFASIWRECHEIFVNYPLSIVRTINNNLDDVVEIFERINQGGKRLTAFDLVQASTWSPNFDLNENIQKLNNSFDSEKYGKLQDKTIVFALCLNIFNNYNNLIQLQLDASNCKKVWSKTAKSIKQSIDFIKSMGIKDDFTPYHTLIPMIQFYFYKLTDEEIIESHRKELEKWFWNAKFSNRYSGTSTANLKEDCAWILDILK
ncbi:MAG: DUF262 domain-containing protein [Bacteroidales bacterium]|nr:DUF262 domain-containing protein [Bacteroidales bacterium]